MSSPTQDLLALVRLLLVEASSISSIVGDRVTGPSAPRTGTEDADTLYPRIVLDLQGGGMISAGALQNGIVHVYAYSRVSQADAWRMFDAVRPVLRHARLARDGISSTGSIRETGSPVAGFNPDVRSWFVRGTFRAQTTCLTPGE